MRAIFISYRRDDSEGHAGRLFDDLVAHFGKDSVFMDVVDIEPGRDFRRVIDQQVASCGVLLAVIGKGWCDAKDSAGRRRLDDPGDFVRLETVSALKRDIPVIPVLVHGAAMPHAEDLPQEVQELAYRNGVELTHARWDSDVQVLIDALRPHVDAGQDNAKSMMAATESAALGAGAPPAKKSWRALIAASSAVALLVVGGLVSYLHNETGEKAAAAEKLAADNPTANEAAVKKVAEKLPETLSGTLSGGPGATSPASLPSPGQPSDWMTFAELREQLRGQAKGTRFPDALEVRCTADSRVELRARFGPLPQGKSEFSWGVSDPAGQAQHAAELTARGFTLFARQTCAKPSGELAYASVWVK